MNLAIGNQGGITLVILLSLVIPNARDFKTALDKDRKTSHSLGKYFRKGGDLLQLPSLACHVGYVFVLELRNSFLFPDKSIFLVDGNTFFDQKSTKKKTPPML